MSKYTGKFDFCDHLLMMDEPFDFSKATIKHNGKVLDIQNLYEAMPYYGHIIGVSSFSDGKYYLELAREPYYDIQEREHRDINIEIIRNLFPLMVQKCIDINYDNVLEFYKRRNNGLNRDLEDIKSLLKYHFYQEPYRYEYSEMYRQELINDMIAAGYDKTQAEKIIYHEM